MRTPLIFSLVCSALLATATAGEHKISSKDPIASITVPEDWKAEEADGALEISSPDDEIYLSFEVNDTDTIEGAIQEAMGYLKKSKVKIDKASEKKNETKYHGMDLTSFSWDGTDSDGATKVNLTIFGVSKTKGLLMLYWASPAGETKHAKDLEKIQESIKPLGK